MRMLVDSLIAVMLICIFGAVLLHHRAEQQEIERYRQAREALSRLHEQAIYRRALGETEHDDPKEPPPFPAVIEAGWFGDRIPLNPQCTPTQPWIDVAPEGDNSDHPPDPVLVSETQAGFWYNPARGVFRARVAERSSNEATLAEYNRVNGVALLSLPTDDNPQRRPVLADWGRLPVLADKLPTPPAAPDAQPPSTRPAEEAPAPRRTLLSAGDAAPAR